MCYKTLGHTQLDLHNGSLQRVCDIGADQLCNNPYVKKIIPW